MNETAFIRGFMDEMEKQGVIQALLPLAARALPMVGRVATKLGPKLLQASKSVAGKAMSAGTKGGVPGVRGKLSQSLNIASNLGGFADIMRARQQKQPANAGNTISTPQ